MKPAALLALRDAQRAKVGLPPLTPAKPPRAARGTGRVGAGKAQHCADLRERSAADVALTVEVTTPNPLNRSGRSRHFWAVDADRKRVEEATAVGLHGLVPPRLPAAVTLTRVSPATLDAHDGLPAALKHVVDGLAEWLGCDDGDTSAVTWTYAQRRERARHCVEVLVRHHAPDGAEQE